MSVEQTLGAGGASSCLGHSGEACAVEMKDSPALLEHFSCACASLQAELLAALGG